MKTSLRLRFLGIAIVRASLTALLICSHAKAGLIVFTDETLFNAAAGGTTLIDFDSFTTGDVLSGNEFSMQGLSISSIDGHDLNIVTFDPSAPHVVNPDSFGSVPNALTSSIFYSAGTPTFDDGRSDSMLFEFSGHVSAAGLYVGQNDVNGTELRILDRAGSELGMFTVPSTFQGGQDGTFFGVLSDNELIGAIETVEPANDADAIFYDNIRFNSVAVPEPSSWLILLLAVAIIVVQSRHRRLPLTRDA